MCLRILSLSLFLSLLKLIVCLVGWLVGLSRRGGGDVLLLRKIMFEDFLCVCVCNDYQEVYIYIYIYISTDCKYSWNTIDGA